MGASEILCNTTTGAGCAVKPQGSNFYPFWSLNNTQRIDGSPRGACVWNFGNVLPGVTNADVRQGRPVRRAQCRAVRRHQHQPGHDQPGDRG